jgi:signal transduction histidine kinase
MTPTRIQRLFLLMFAAPITPVNNRWSLSDKGPLLKSAASILFVLAALALTQLLWLVVDKPVSSPLFLLAIVLSAWTCGFRYGIVSAIISGVVIDYFFVQPQYEFSGSRDEVVRLLIFVFEGAILSWLIERLRLAGEEIKTSHQKLQALTDHQERFREEERKQMAREVHDELGQALTGLKMNIHILKRQANLLDDDSGLISGGLDDLTQMVDSTIGTVRRIASELRPSLLDDFGLVAAIEWQVQEFGKRTSIISDFVSNSELVDLGAERNTAMYRIVQEALTNIARHAGARHVLVELEERSDQVRITVRDDGRGMINASSRGTSLGVIGMQERSRMIGGELKIDSTPAVGTAVKLRIPLKENGHENGKRGKL